MGRVHRSNVHSEKSLYGGLVAGQAELVLGWPTSLFQQTTFDNCDRVEKFKLVWNCERLLICNPVGVLGVFALICAYWTLDEHTGLIM